VEAADLEVIVNSCPGSLDLDHFDRALLIYQLSNPFKPIEQIAEAFGATTVAIKYRQTKLAYKAALTAIEGTNFELALNARRTGLHRMMAILKTGKDKDAIEAYKVLAAEAVAADQASAVAKQRGLMTGELPTPEQAVAILRNDPSMTSGDTIDVEAL
jgi:D-alanyl-D-alanine dipeptidase